MNTLLVEIEWTIADALTLVRDIQPKLHAQKWHVTMGGSVLNNGASSKDLDLYVLPFNNDTTSLILPLLTELLGASEPISAMSDRYPANEYYAHKLKFSPGGRRIDVFIAKHVEAA